jgi:hypothetical protein
MVVPQFDLFHGKKRAAIAPSIVPAIASAVSPPNPAAGQYGYGAGGISGFKNLHKSLI